MKLKLLFLSLGVLFAARAFAQESISLKVRDMALIQVFETLEEENGYRFFYSDDLVDPDKSVTFDLNDADIRQVLAELELQTGLSFRLMEDQLIVVVPSGEPQQPAIVRGTVTSVTDQYGLPGVTVVVLGTSEGVITDLNGNYQIEVPDQYAVLSFRYVGFQSQEVPLNGRTNIDVELVEDILSIEEVVVTALAIERDKNSLGYSITQVGSDELNAAKQNNPMNSLAGKVAGLQISSTPTGVDGSTRVILRGVASLSSGNRPLIVVDGIPVDGGNYGSAGLGGGKDMGDALSDINPEDIESMSVLKGAGAAAAYGSRGANGVILITTKKGTQRKGLGVSFNSSYILEEPSVYPRLQNKYGQGAFGQHPTEVVPDMASIKGEEPWIWSWGRPMEGQTLPNWLDEPAPYSPQPNPFSEFYRTGSNLMNTLALDGGSENTTMRASITFQNGKGIYPTNDMNKQTINLRSTSKVGKRIMVDGKFTYIHNAVENRPYISEDVASSSWAWSILPRDVSLQSLEDNYVDENGIEQWAWDRTLGNIYWALENKQNRDEKHRLQGLFSINYDISERFDLLLRSGLDFTNRNAFEYAAQGSRVNSNYNGWFGHSFDNRLEMNSDFLLSYKEDLSKNINLYLNLGGNHRYNQYKSIWQGGNTWRVPDFFHISNIENYSTSQYFNEKEVLSLYGLGTLTYANFLYLDFTYRNDWSSTLPAESNSYKYYSGNLSLVFTELIDISDSFLSLGKIRASYARVGNDTGPYQTMNYYSVWQTQWPYPVGSMSGRLAFADFKPEITTSWELGTSLGFLKNRINLDFAYYNSLSENQIMDVKLAPSSGFDIIKQNAGAIRNNGFEALIAASPLISNKGLNWEVSLNFSKNYSLVESLAEGESRKVLETTINGLVLVEVRPGEPFGSLYGRDYLRDENGNKLIDDDGRAIPGEVINLGDINPDLIGGLSNHFSYKGLSLSFLIDFQLGGEFYSHGLLYRDLMGTSVESLKGRDEWYSTHEGLFHSENISGVIPKGYVEDGVNVNTGQPNDIPLQPMLRNVNVIWFDRIVSDYILDATNVRLREVVLGYNLPRSLLEKTPFTDVNISLVGRNLFLFYNAAKHVDPESGFNSGSVGNAVEATALPATRSYGFSVTVNF
jgi:TonB-linked SusC/RagA family outer membrane protein